MPQVPRPPPARRPCSGSRSAASISGKSTTASTPARAAAKACRDWPGRTRTWGRAAAARAARARGPARPQGRPRAPAPAPGPPGAAPRPTRPSESTVSTSPREWRPATRPQATRGLPQRRRPGCLRKLDPAMDGANRASRGTMEPMSEVPPGGADFFGRIPLFREFARLMAPPPGRSTGSWPGRSPWPPRQGPSTWACCPAAPAGGRARPGRGAAAGTTACALPSCGSSRSPPCPAPRWHLEAKPEAAPTGPRPAIGGCHPDRAGRPPHRGARHRRRLGQPAGRRMVQRVGGLVFGIQVGTLVGQLARSVLGQYELPLPAADPAKVLLVPRTSPPSSSRPACPATRCGSGWPAPGGRPAAARRGAVAARPPQPRARRVAAATDPDASQ